MGILVGVLKHIFNNIPDDFKLLYVDENKVEHDWDRINCKVDIINKKIVFYQEEKSDGDTGTTKVI